MIGAFVRPLLAMIPGVGPILAAVPPGGWKIIGLAAAIGFGALYVDRKATYRERAKCTAAAAIAAKKAADVDIAALQEQARAATETAKTLEAERDQADERARQLAAELAKRPDAARCPISEDDARRLRGNDRPGASRP